MATSGQLRAGREAERAADLQSGDRTRTKEDKSALEAWRRR